MDFAVPTDHRVKIKESEKIDKYSDIAWELKNKKQNKTKQQNKTVQYESDGDTNCNWCTWCYWGGILLERI